LLSIFCPDQFPRRIHKHHRTISNRPGDFLCYTPMSGIGFLPGHSSLPRKAG
jgi:hypothetical protein